MEFDPKNHIIQLCLQGVNLVGQGEIEKANALFHQARAEATNDLEHFIAAYNIARWQRGPAEQLNWFQIALQYALRLDDEAVKSAYKTLYTQIARCYQMLGDAAREKENNDLAGTFSGTPADHGPFYHGTKADLQPGDLLTAGRQSNYQSDLLMNHIYFTALVNGAGLAAGLAKGEGPGRIYLIEPMGPYENDPNVTDQKFPGNLTRSYRTRSPLKVLAELKDWQQLTSGELHQWQEKLAASNGKIIN